MPLDGDRSWTADAVLPGEEIRKLIERDHPLEELPREPSATARVYRFADGARRDRLHQPGVRAVLRRLRPDPADRRWQAANLPLLVARDRPSRAAARRRRRCGDRADHPRRRLAQGAQAPRRRDRLLASRHGRCARSAASAGPPPRIAARAHPRTQLAACEPELGSGPGRARRTRGGRRRAGTRR